VTPHDQSSEPPRSSTTRLGIGYATGLTFAHLLTAAEVFAVVWALSGQTFGDTQALQTRSNPIILAVVVGLGTVVAAASGGDSASRRAGRHRPVGFGSGFAPECAARGAPRRRRYLQPSGLGRIRGRVGVGLTHRFGNYRRFGSCIAIHNPAGMR
jgi:hypothetical protein